MHCWKATGGAGGNRIRGIEGCSRVSVRILKILIPLEGYRIMW